MKNIKYIVMIVFLSACAHTIERYTKSDVKEKASYAFNCREDLLKVNDLGDDLFEVKGCNQEAEFQIKCSLGPCYVIEK